MSDRNNNEFSVSADGRYHCKICLSDHESKANYEAHVLGQRHKANVDKRERIKHRQEKERQLAIQNEMNPRHNRQQQHSTSSSGGAGDKIPSYDVKQYVDGTSGVRTIRMEFRYPEVTHGFTPIRRLMGAHEQKKEAPDPTVLYVVVACQPYRNVAIKVPNLPSLLKDRIQENWDDEQKVFTIVLLYNPRGV
eukprot:PhF_6_TR5778/c0_g1_i2/m.8530/K12826/SF3A2, SAP62; splicing factor 3A subunit 2